MSEPRVSPVQFDFKTVEKKWQDFWHTNHTYQAVDGDTTREKKYILVEFPFPSGASLHVGHVFRYTVPDIYSRFLRQRGYNVLFPMGWDAFGLPAEEYARKTGQNPKITTEQNIIGIKKNIQRMGYGIDWNREFSTTDPEYYKWTQWIFKKFYEQGLAVQKDVELWWCENLGTVLANEEVYDGPDGEKLSERGDHPVEKKKMKQWVLKMPEYAEKLLTGLEETHFPDHIKAMQRTWIGKSEGVTVDWDLVPRGYMELLDSYPTFEDNDNTKKNNTDNTKIVRERATCFIRIKGTNEFIGHTQKRYSDKNWTFLPGGGVDVGETPLGACIRETSEELGLSNLVYVTDLGTVRCLSGWTGQLQRSVEHYFLLEISPENLAKRQIAELDDSQSEMFGSLKQATIEDYKQNDWPQLNKIIKNLEEYITTGKITQLYVQNREIVIGTASKGKIERWKRELNFNGVHFVTVDSLGVKVGEIEETGKDELENAKLKAKAYFDATGKPSLSGDSGLYLDGVTDQEQPGDHVNRRAGVLDTDDEDTKWGKMISYYQGLASKYGGQIKGHFKDVFALYDGLNYYTSTGLRYITLTDVITHPGHKHFPLCNLYIADSAGKYYYDLNAKEMLEYTDPSRSSAIQMLQNYVFDGESAGDQNPVIKTYTTRVDTLPSSTFVVVAPEYPNLLELCIGEYKYEVANYIEQTKAKSERDRQINKEKTGVFTGRFVRNPLTNLLCPVWVTDFVLGGYGTGAVMGDAHDERDAELALKYDIYLAENISKDGQKRSNIVDKIRDQGAFVDDGILFGSGEFDGLTSEVAREKIAQKLGVMGKGVSRTNYRMRDFVFSRQRYWGEPFPLEYLDGDVETILVDAVFCLIHKGDEGLSLNTELCDFLEAQNKQIIVVTNAKDSVLLEIKKLLEHTKFVVFSLQFNPEKTDPEYYKKLIQMYSLDLSKTIYIDHSLDNIAASTQCGIETYQYVDNQETIDFLKARIETKTQAVSDSKLPLILPDLEDFEPNKDGRSPLAKSDWISVRDEKGNVIGLHEADTMPNWAGSSWYYLRFTDPKNQHEFASQDNLNYWLPVDHYFGGSEHTTLHLLYSRFWHRFLYDIGRVPTLEPYDYRTNGGILLGPDGSKMSKSKGNVIQPDDKLAAVGADALRLYIAFIGPYDATVIWQDGGLKACKNLVDKIWNYQTKVDFGIEWLGDTALSKEEKSLVVSYHKFVKNMTEMLENMRNNVAVAEIMSFSNLLKDVSVIPGDIWENLVKAISPFMPHISEELTYAMYKQKGGKASPEDSDFATNYTSVHLKSYPTFDPELCIDDTVKYAVQVNGKVRADFEISSDASEADILTQAKASVPKYLEGKTIKFSKIIPNKLVTLVVE